MAKLSAGRSALDHALGRLVAEVYDGVRHGYFEFGLTCEVVNQERRRLTIRAGKTYQFTIPKEDCLQPVERAADSCDGSGDSAD